jgi:hypothetical protein
MLQPRLRVLIHKDEVFAALIIASRRPHAYGKRELSFWNKSPNKLGKGFATKMAPCYNAHLPPIWSAVFSR